MIKLLTALSLAGTVPAQFAPLPPQSFYEVGRIDWVMPCGPWSVNTELTAAPWDRVVDPGYPAPGPAYACRLGGIFYMRARQHTGVCPDYMSLGTSFPPVFLFGPRTSSFIQVNTAFAYPGQNVIFNAMAGAYMATHHGPWEFDTSLDCWAIPVAVPNMPSIVGTEWEAQAAFWSSATGQMHFGISRYTRLI